MRASPMMTSQGIGLQAGWSFEYSECECVGIAWYRCVSWQPPPVLTQVTQPLPPPSHPLPLDPSIVLFPELMGVFTFPISYTVIDCRVYLVCCSSYSILRITVLLLVYNSCTVHTHSSGWVSARVLPQHVYTQYMLMYTCTHVG